MISVVLIATGLELFFLEVYFKLTLVGLFYALFKNPDRVKCALAEIFAVVKGK